jgi:hypothetical protein
MSLCHVKVSRSMRENYSRREGAVCSVVKYLVNYKFCVACELRK